MTCFTIQFNYIQGSPELTVMQNRENVSVSWFAIRIQGMCMIRCSKGVLSHATLGCGNPLRQIFRENNLCFFADLIRRFFCHEITATFYSGTTIAAIDQRNRICRFAFAAGGQTQNEKCCDYDTKFLFHRHLHGALDTMTFVPFVVRSIFMR